MQRIRYIFTGLLMLVCSTMNAAEDISPLLKIGKVTTEAQQSKISPKLALERLKQGNQRFLQNKMKQRDYLAQAKQSAYGQYPWAVILNCMDSRSVPEFFFDQGLADLFTLRVAGNVLNEDILGSMEFATKAAGARLIVVLAHTSCGAVAGACEDVTLGHLDHVLDKIKPVIASARKETGLKRCDDPQLIDQIARNNALAVANEIVRTSPIISQLIKDKKVGIIAGIHNLRTGEVLFYEDARLLPE